MRTEQRVPPEALQALSRGGCVCRADLRGALSARNLFSPVELAQHRKPFTHGLGGTNGSLTCPGLHVSKAKRWQQTINDTGLLFSDCQPGNRSQIPRKQEVASRSHAENKQTNTSKAHSVES